MAEKTERNPKGAGRPKGRIASRCISIWCTEDECKKIKELAESKGKTISRYVIDEIFKVESHDIDALAYMNLSETMKDIK